MLKNIKNERNRGLCGILSVNNLLIGCKVLYLQKNLDKIKRDVIQRATIITRHNMNKTDLINEIAAKAQINKTAAKAALDATLESIEQALANDDKVQLIGFGTFTVLEKEARIGINPRTKEKIEIPARKVVKFKPAADLAK